MAFVLKVSQGPDAGAEFPVDGTEATLGRTNDNDIVIADPASSRSHARVYEDASIFWVEDLGSANGTGVNGRRISEPTPLSNGDKITIGDVELTVVLPDATLLAPPSDMSDAPAEDPNATLIKMPDELEGVDPNATIAPTRPPAKRTPARRPTRPPRPADTADEEEAEEEAPPEPQDTADDDEGYDEPAHDEDDGPPPETTKNFKVPPPKALARKSSPALRPVKAEPDAREEKSAMTAAERARQRRELSKSAGGKLQLAFQELPKPARLAVTVVGGAMALGLLALLVMAVLPRARGPRKVEPMTLTANAPPIAEDFGVGEGVTFEKVDMKSFEFSLASPTRVVGVLHFMAKDISKDEVAIVLNGAELGSVPPDSLDADTRELDKVLPAELLDPRAANTLSFDNVNNPPGDETWRVWNVWVEIIPVPELSVELATARAREAVEKAQTYYERKAIGADNLFRAWKTYREAWLVLEATPDRPEDLLALARSRMRDLRPELDRKCSTILVEYKKLTANGQWDEARAVMEDVKSYFPTKEHPCHNLSLAVLADESGFVPAE